jgi:hypothetical protein
MSQANAPVPVADIPVSEKPTASQANSSAASQATTSPQANTTSTPVNTTEPRSSAATPPVVVSNGTVTAPKPAQSLTPTSVPQVAVIPASSNGTASIHAHDHWRVGLCDADDMETCVRCILQAFPYTRSMFPANTRPVRRLVCTILPRRPYQEPSRQSPSAGSRLRRMQLHVFDLLRSPLLLHGVYSCVHEQEHGQEDLQHQRQRLP